MQHCDWRARAPTQPGLSERWHLKEDEYELASEEGTREKRWGWGVHRKGKITFHSPEVREVKVHRSLCSPPPSDHKKNASFRAD